MLTGTGRGGHSPAGTRVHRQVSGGHTPRGLPEHTGALGISRMCGSQTCASLLRGHQLHAWLPCPPRTPNHPPPPMPRGGLSYQHKGVRAQTEKHRSGVPVPFMAATDPRTCSAHLPPPAALHGDPTETPRTSSEPLPTSPTNTAPARSHPVCPNRRHPPLPCPTAGPLGPGPRGRTERGEPTRDIT